MILKALYDYYQRLGSLPSPGLEKKKITFLIVIDAEGNFVRIEDTRTGKEPKEYVVPRGVSRSSDTVANLLWDNGKYVLGIPKDGSSKSLRDAEEKNSAFICKCRELLDKTPDSKAVGAVLKFYDNGGVDKLRKSGDWNELEKQSAGNFSFILDGSLRIVAELDEVKNCVAKEFTSETGGSLQTCLITGKKVEPIAVTTATQIAGSKSNARLVSFQISSGYDSYGKEQCANAPIGKEAEFAYTTALKTLLDKKSKNRFLLGDRSFVFWASNREENESSKDAEDGFFAFLNDNSDNPNAGLGKLKSVLKSIWSGETPGSSDGRFYVLGLAPNAARLAVVYWNECSVKDFAYNLWKHFEDMEIDDNRKVKKPYCGLYSMLSAVTLGGKSSEVQPNLPEALLKSVLQNTAYPFPLYTACIRRINAELSETTCFSITRMAILKAFLNRQTRQTNHKKLEIMLDKENTNEGYLCGRLFAVLVKVQEDANNVNTIAERYMNAASASPSSVFGTILNLSVHHTENLKDGAKIFYNKLKQEIIGKLPSGGFPAHLGLQDQGRFFVGYYQQRQDLFTKKDADA